MAQELRLQQRDEVHDGRLRSVTATKTCGGGVPVRTAVPDSGLKHTPTGNVRRRAKMLPRKAVRLRLNPVHASLIYSYLANMYPAFT